MKVLLPGFIIFIIMSFLPYSNAKACGGMTTVNPPPLLRVTGPTLSAQVADLPQYTCEIRVLDLQTFAAGPGENCGCGFQNDDPVADLIVGAVLVEAGTSKPLEGFGFFGPNSTAAQLNADGDGVFLALPVTGAFAGQWFTAQTVTTQSIKAGQPVDMVFLVNTTSTCGDLARLVGKNNAVVMGATDRNGLFNDPTHFDFAVNLEVEKTLNTTIVIAIGAGLATISGALFVIRRRRSRS